MNINIWTASTLYDNYDDMLCNDKIAFIQVGMLRFNSFIDQYLKKISYWVLFVILCKSVFWFLMKKTSKEIIVFMH